MNVYFRFSVFLVLASSYYIMAADQHRSSERATRVQELEQQCADGSGTVCDPSITSSGDYIAGKMELLTQNDKDFLKTEFAPFARIAEDYPRFYDWTEATKKEKDPKILKEILALEKDMRQAAGLASELVQAKKSGEDTAKQQPKEASFDEPSAGEPSEEPKQQAAGNSERPETEGAEGSSAKPQPNTPPKTGPAKIFKPRLAEIPLLRVALTNFAKNTRFSRNLDSGNEFFSDEENVEALLGRIKDRISRFGDRIGLETSEAYPVSRTGAPLDEKDYREFPDLKKE